MLYCNPEDIQDIAMVIRNVILHEHLRDELRRRGKERAKNFSWDKFVSRLFNVINNLH
jgi:glycosyltransferase involved in cell wall biosynthesis